MKKVNLILSGGGARGYIHIGVIKALLKKKYNIISISGTSMGALIGAMYAAGKLEEYEKWITQKSLFDIITTLKINVRSNINHHSLLSLDKVFEEIREFTDDLKIENLNIPFTAVATNLTKNKEIWFQKGNLFEALQASTAIPGYFEPLIKNNEIFVDGGVLNSMPIAPTLAYDADLTIAIDINSNIKQNYKIKYDNNFLEKMWFNFLSPKKDLKNLSINLMMDYISNLRINEYKPDILIPFSRNIANTFAFHKHKELIEIGYKEALKYL